MYVVTVDFFIKPAYQAEFRREMLANAATSVNNEAGCSQFDVTVAADNPNHIFLYEIYDDEAAFKTHLASEHFQQFDQKTRGWVEDKRVGTFYRLVCPGSGK